MGRREGERWGGERVRGGEERGREVGRREGERWGGERGREGLS